MLVWPVACLHLGTVTLRYLTFLRHVVLHSFQAMRANDVSMAIAEASSFPCVLDREAS